MMILSDFDCWFVLEICCYNNSIYLSFGCMFVVKWEVFLE